MIINPKDTDHRVNIKLDSGWLSYKTTVVYLGVIFSNSGVVNEDLNDHVAEKRKSVYFKLANFMRNNSSAPITIKLKILKACLESSLLYGCEAWSSGTLLKVETLYRKAIKITLSMTSHTSSEIVYIECGLPPTTTYHRTVCFLEKNPV